MNSILTKDQKKQLVKFYHDDGEYYRMTVTLRYDDECGNGHNTFAMTADIYRKAKNSRWVYDSGGCCHDEIIKQFPDLAPLVKWHLCSADEPMHCIANTLYLAGDRDCWGLRKGEERQIKNGKTGLPCWILEGDSHAEKYVDAATCPTKTITLKYVPWNRVGEGKERELDATRRAAIWLNATDEELTAPGLEERLRARLPMLMDEFRRAMEGLGFVY